VKIKKVYFINFQNFDSTASNHLTQFECNWYFDKLNLSKSYKYFFIHHWCSIQISKSILRVILSISNLLTIHDKNCKVKINDSIPMQLHFLELTDCQADNSELYKLYLHWSLLLKKLESEIFFQYLFLINTMSNSDWPAEQFHRPCQTKKNQLNFQLAPFIISFQIL